MNEKLRDLGDSFFSKKKEGARGSIYLVAQIQTVTKHRVANRYLPV